VIICGHIDLSVGSIAGFVGAGAAALMVNDDMPWPIAVVLCLLLGAAIGAWQGFWIAYFGIPSFIVTLAGMLAFRGLTQYVLEGQSIAPFPRAFQQISSGFLPELDPRSLYHWYTIILGAIAIVAALWQEVRQRRTQARYGFEWSRSRGSSPSASALPVPSPPSPCCWRATVACRSSASSSSSCWSSTRL